MAGIRIDKALFYLRLAKSRGVAQAMVKARHMRLNGYRVERGAQTLDLGDILTLPIGQNLRVLRILAIPTRRGSPIS
jgi:ribosome-associated heat shock protein Hsp15